MTTALLDPIVLSSAVEGDAGALGALLRFEDLVRRRSLHLKVVPFVTKADESIIWSRAPRERAKHSGWAALSRLFPRFKLRPDDVAGATATVAQGPTDCPTTWRQALRRELADPTLWRRPVVATSRDRLGLWGANNQACITRDDDPAPAPRHFRNLVACEDFELHPHLEPDHDPWDLRHVHPVETGGRPHPCRLPRPRQLLDLRLEELPDALPRARWKTDTHWFFVPEQHWHPNKVPKASWRQGLAFDKGHIPGHSGWRDCNGFIWEWHQVDREWDVQLLNGKHEDVSPEGLWKK